MIVCDLAAVATLLPACLMLWQLRSLSLRLDGMLESLGARRRVVNMPKTIDKALVSIKALVSVFRLVTPSRRSAESSCWANIRARSCREYRLDRSNLFTMHIGFHV